MIIWRQYEKTSQCSSISDNVPAAWAAGEQPGLNTGVCKHTQAMSRDGLHHTLQPHLRLQILAVDSRW